MKLRIKGDSLRLRLTRGEVQELAERGAVEDRVRFGGGVSFVYRLRRDPAASSLTASYGGGAVDVRVPERAALSWCESDEVTLAGSQPAAADAELQIVVEKDFGY